MAKKGWFSMIKKLFLWDTESSLEKKEKRRGWIFGRVKRKRLATITAPPPPPKETRPRESEEEHSKHALTVAVASAAAAAEAAITAAQVAVEVVRLQSAHQQYNEKQEESQPVKTSNNGALHSTHQCQRKIQESSAIKIQTAFRGYLAKKALRALKGIVKLQAIIRGRAVRRQALSTLKCLESIVSIQSQVVFSRRLQMVEGRWDYGEHEEMQSSSDKIIRMDSNSERRWDDSILLKEEVDASCISKKEAVLKRERVKEYTFNHRRSAESERNKINGRWRYWMEQWVDTQLSKSKELEDLDSVFSSHYSRPGEECGRRQLKLRNIQRHNHVEALDSPSLAPRNSFPHRSQTSEAEEHHSVPSSPAIPTYMAATKSAQAKARTTSSPRARIGGNFDINSDGYSPLNKKLPIVTSLDSDALSNGRMGKLGSNQQRSPSLKGLPKPQKLSQRLRDLSINSDCSVPI